MIKVGIIGKGFGEKVMKPAYESASARVVEVVSPRDADAITALCARADVDLISVHSPPALHAGHVEQAIDAGRAVLCDKPVGMSFAQTTSLATRAHDAGVLNFVNFEFRALPSRVELREHLRRGTIGIPEHVSWTYPLALTRYPVWADRWLFNREQGGGWLGGWGVHALDALFWLGFEIEQATALLRTTISRRPGSEGIVESTAEDGFSAAFVLEGGRTASIDTSFSSSVSLPQRLVVHGSEGALELVGDRDLWLWKRGAEPERLYSLESPDPVTEAVRLSTAALCARVAVGRQEGPSLRDAARVDRVIEELRAQPRVALSPHERTVEV